MDVDQFLAPFRQPWKKAFQARTEQLPPELARLTRTLSTDQHYQKHNEAISTLADLLHTGGAATQQALAETFFPHFAETASRTLAALQARHPYPQGHARRAFRAPGHLLQAKRAASWIWQTWVATRDYPQDLEWFAVHAGLFGSWQAHGLSLLLAQALDDGNETVFQILRDTASTLHPVARMGRHVPGALLASTRPEAWTLAEQLLLAAQRQEGLRQVILETVDEAHPEAFNRFLHLVLGENLLRFAACLRAADVWFGLNYDVTDVKTVHHLLTQALSYLEDPESARSAAESGAGTQLYLALFTLAMNNAEDAATLARNVLTDPDAERRMAAVQFLMAAELTHNEELDQLIDDPDVRIGALAAERINRWNAAASGLSFQALERYIARLPKERQHRPLLFPWLGGTPERAELIDSLPGLLGDQPISLLVPYLAQMTSSGKSLVLAQFRERQKTQPLDSERREVLITLLQDRNSSVAEEAVNAASTLSLASGEEEIVRTLLKRRSPNLRRGLIRMLSRTPEQANANAQELLATRNVEQRQAGLQLLLEVGGTLPEHFQPRNTTEETLVAQLTTPSNTITLNNGLGLFDPAQLAPLTELQAKQRDYPQDVRRGAALLISLDELIHTHRETPISNVDWDGEETLLLGTVSPWQLRGKEVPLQELWKKWWERRPDAAPGDITRMTWALRHRTTPEGLPADDDELDFEVLLDDDTEDTDTGETDTEEQRQAEAAASASALLHQRTILRLLGPQVPFKIEYTGALQIVMEFFKQHLELEDTDLSLDAWETGLSYVPQDAEMITDPRYTWRQQDPRELVSWLNPGKPEQHWTAEQLRRSWNLTVSQDRAFPKLPRSRPDRALLLEAHQHGWASEHDLLDTLIGPRERSEQFRDLSLYTERTLREALPTPPTWLKLVSDVRERVLDAESVRGDLETPATPAALSLSSITGADRTLALLASLGKNPLKRGYTGSNQSRDAVFSHLIRNAFPGPQDTPAAFVRQIKQYNFTDARLLDLVMFAPQWSALVAHTLKWKGLQDGVYWLHAHTRDDVIPSEMEAEIAERTPLSAQTLTEGAVDVAWFKKMHRSLGAEGFSSLLGAAKYASSSGGHKRAELFAKALLGQILEAELRSRITEKRSGDAVRALGLLPLSRKKALSAQELEARYRLLSDFRREAKQFGPQRQASERLAADIGLQNLARTAGYPDPQRLMWAMEARLAPDWQQTVDVEGVTLSIAMTPAGEASLRIKRGEKVLKALPAALKKRPEVLGIKQAVSELQGARKRMRAALEEAMVRGDHFQAQELRALAEHPVIAPMLRALVWVMSEHHVGWWHGKAFQTTSGEESVNDQALRLAHPHDLFVDGHWPEFQEQVMLEGLVQPFKQVFREYYPITPAETQAHRSARYAGHHVQPTKAAALFKTRGWVAVHEEGVRKTDHAEGVNVWVDTAVGYGTPNEVEGAGINAVYFVRKGETEAMLLSSVPPRLFSEAMRDLDLVVSVAHVGGVDPEASQSTVEMRADLLRETMRLLKLGNVRVEHQHALIQGHHAQYSVHLGSGTVHRLPGGFLCLIPVHNQHQGRLFLPFADPDPRTAEVISKVLLLAEDKKIQDPTILEQLR